MNQTLYITDMNLCKPASALADQFTDGCWRVVPYETVDGICGHMLMATSEIDAPPVNIELNVQGWYRIILGLGCPSLNDGAAASIRVKLDNDPCYSALQTRGRYWWMEIQEITWREAELTGRSISFYKPNGIHNGGSIQVQSYIAYIRLEPLSEDEIQSISSRPDKKLIATEDGWSYIAVDYPTSVEELYESIFSYRDSDIKTVFYNAAAGDYVNYPDTNVGTSYGIRERPVYPRPLDKAYDRCMDILREKHIDPVGELCDFAHSLGLEFHATVRTGSFVCEPPFDEFYTSQYYMDHPEFRCRDKDGREIPRLSYAFPEVQEHMLALYSEIAERNIDGFGWIFVRGLPVMLYEEPVVNGFIQKYGIDPRKLGEDDVRVTSFRAGIFTDFVIRTRNTLNKLREEQGRPVLKFSAVIPATERVNRIAGLDIRTWAVDGLIDILAVDISVQDRNNPNNEIFDNIELEYFQNLLSGTRCIFAPQIGYFDDERGVQRINDLYKRGIEAALIWDANGYYRYNTNVWTMLAKYGSSDLIARWADESRKPEIVIKPLKSLGGYTMDKYPGNLAY